MASTTRDPNTPGQHKYNAVPLDGDAVVISGISCIMPGCHNIMEFADKLYGKVNMTKCGRSRWDHKHVDLPKYNGTIPQVDRFDAQFFMVFHSLSQTMDAMTRKMLEQSYQAVFDAGICPTELSGKSVGVFIATGFCETDKASWFADTHFGILGSNRAMSANRISYYLNLKGPSMHMDADATGSALALEKAYELITSGQCEAAIVGAGKLLLHPQSSLNHHKLVPFCPDGNIKSYDEKADGHVLSEGFTVIFLQKHKDAKRIYASIRHVKTAFSGTNVDGGIQKFTPYRDPVALAQFFRDFYNEIDISPTDVEYVEGFGSAVPDADKAELKAIDEVFCKNRNNVLPVGSVMSNTGYTEAASCITGIMKLILAYHKGKIASNINCDSPCQDVEGLKEGRMRILTEDENFGRTYAAVNNFSITGINAHVLLQGYYKPKNRLQYQSKIPYLLTVSGRQETSVKKILDDIKSHPLDPEEITLLHNIHRNRIPKHMARGFGIYSINDVKETVTLKEEVDYYDDAKRPLWFVYSGMGSQWAEMGAHLMRIPIFAEAIMKCHKALEPKGFDLINIITYPDGSLFDNILNSFVGIAAIQIGLTDVLTAIGLVPDNIIGHSVGELGCAYADGCVTAEEMVLMAYSRGLVSKQTEFIRGSMAAIGIGFKQISNLIPPEIEVACHNGPDSCTISGPADIMKTFVTQLSAQGIFAKEVSCSNIAYHSRYISNAGPGLLKFLEEIIKSPKIRSERWLSTSVPQDKWDEPIAKYSSAEYHTNNLLSPVLFEETIKLVPYNAVLIEIAPHGLLQAILKRSLPATCKNVALTRRGHKDNSMFLLEAIGTLYMEGFDVNLSTLYPKIEFPVSTETRPLSHLIEWAYAEKYKVCQYVSVLDKKINSVYRPIITIYDEEYEYLSGNVINGNVLFPFSGALVFVWEMLAMIVGKRRNYLTVQFKDITCHVQPLLSEDKPLYLTVLLQRGSGRFEVTYDQGIIVDGYVNAINVFNDFPKNLKTDNEHLELELTNDDIYKLLFERGYQYKSDFRIIQQANFSFTHANLIWNDNWVTFLDGLLQLNILRRSHNGISQPQYIKRICIDVMDHINQVSRSKNKNGLFNAVYSEIHKVVRCGGIAIEHLTYNDKPAFLPKQALLKELKFVPFDQNSNDGILETLYVYLQIVSENLNKTFLKAIYISESNDHFSIEDIISLLDTPPRIKLNVIKMKTNEIKKDYVLPDVILLNNTVADESTIEALYHNLPSDKFIIIIGEDTKIEFPSSFYHTICASGKGKKRVELAKWKPPKATRATAVISVRDDTDLMKLKTARTQLSDQDKLLILATYPPLEGLKNLVQLWRSESGKNNVFVLMMNQSCVDLNYVDYPSSDIIFNVFHNGTWGGEYYVPIKEQKIYSDTAALKIGTFGNLNTLTWVDRINETESGMIVKVVYAGLNVYDAKRAFAEISIKDDSHRGFGMDFSGVTERGNHVMGVIQSNAVSGKVIAYPELLWPVPMHWTLEDAATVPLPYCLAFYCLAIKSRLIRKMNVLIHGGAGALGQAAISICLANGCNVFTTVSNKYKKSILCNLFPELPDDHIGNSRDTTFQDMVSKGTKGEGCHIIICSVSGELKKATLNCCAASSITIDTVLIHTQENFTYGMYNMTKSRSYSVIDFASIFLNDNKDQMKVMVSEGIARGYVRPLSRVTYAPEDTPRAFRLLSASGHCGRVLINIGDRVLLTQPRFSCTRNACHLIFCDKDDFGLQLAEKMVSNGTKKLFIHSKRRSSYLKYKTLSWRKRGVQINVSHEDICKMDQVVNVLTDCVRWAPVEGIFIVKTALNDTKSSIETKNLICSLDLISRDLCPSLRYFAVIQEKSSLECFDREISMNRIQQGLNSLLIYIYDLEKFDEKKKSTNCDKGYADDVIKNVGLKWVSAVDGVERAMLSNKANVIVYAKPMGKQSFIEEVINIAGVKITDSVPGNTTLKEIGIENEKAQQLCNIFEKILSITISKENLPHMTISTLKSIQANETHLKKKCNGLDAFINIVDSDELFTDCTVQIRTLVNTSELRPEEFDNELQYLCIVPGIEGLHHRFHKLCERLKIPALVLQPGFDVNDISIENMAQRLTQVLMKKLNMGEHFYLLGYEIGILLVMEMAQILEDRGLTGTIFCVGGTPEDICAIMQAHFGNTDPNKLQNDLIEHVYTLFTKNKSDNLNMVIRNTSNWNDKVEICIQKIHATCSFSKQYLRSYINVVYNRIIMSRDYIWRQKPLKSKMVVLKAILPESSFDSKYYSQIAAVHALNSSLPYALEDLKCSAIVNKYLDPKILDEFNNRNHCETVLINEMQDLIFNYINDDD